MNNEVKRLVNEYTREQLAELIEDISTADNLTDRDELLLDNLYEALDYSI